MTIFLFLEGTKSSALRRIAVEANSTECEDGVPKANERLNALVVDTAPSQF